MADQDKDLTNLFVRHLDDIQLPPRDKWRPAPRKESQLMKTSRYVFYAAAVAAVLVVALIASFGLRDGNQGATSPSQSAATTTSPAQSPATASPSASAATSATALPTGAITGRLAYGSDFMPPVTVYAINTSDSNVWFSTDTPRFGNPLSGTQPPGPTWPSTGPGTYMISGITPGTYFVIAYRNDDPIPPSLKNIPAAYTQWTAKCSSSDPTVPSPPPGPCSSDHSLVPVTVTAGQTVNYIEIVDWFPPQGGNYPPRPR